MARKAKFRPAQWLLARIHPRGDVVAVWLPNWTESLVLEYALAHLGAAALGFNTRYGSHELMDLIIRGRPVGIIAPASFLELDFAGRLRSAINHIARTSEPFSPPWIATVRGTPADAPGLDAGGGTWALAPGSREAPTAAGQPDDIVNYFTTSGSTGAPKLTGHSQAAVTAHARNAADALDLRAGDLVLGALPLSGVFGFLVCWFACFLVMYWVVTAHLVDRPAATDRTVTALVAACAGAVIGLLLFIVIWVVVKGVGHFSPGFLTRS